MGKHFIDTAAIDELILRECDGDPVGYIRSHIDDADRRLLEVIQEYVRGKEDHQQELEEEIAEFHDTFQLLFRGCPSDEVRTKAQALLDKTAQVVCTGITAGIVKALSDCFIFRSRIRKFKAQTTDKEREDIVEGKWRRNAEELELNPEAAVRLCKIVFRVSKNLQKLQIS